jgi:hypothetical protein
VIELNPRLAWAPDEKGRVKLRWESLAFHPSLSEYYDSSDGLEVRLDECDILGHDGLLWILSLARHRGIKRPTYVHLPTDERILSDLEKLRFIKLLLASGGVLVNEHVLWGRKLKSRPHRLAAVSRLSLQFMQFITADNCVSILQELATYFATEIATLMKRSPTGDVISRDSLPLQGAVRELILNIPLHSGCEAEAGSGYACYAHWPAGYPMIRFCCNDLGPGFRRTLHSKQGIRTASEIAGIHRALLLRHEQPENGVFGLFNALPFIFQMHGRVFIRSDDASVTIDFSNVMGRQCFLEGNTTPNLSWIRQITRSKSTPSIPGCHIALDLRL